MLPRPDHLVQIDRAPGDSCALAGSGGKRDGTYPRYIALVCFGKVAKMSPHGA